VWKRTAKGLILTFHLAGINNQNFLMRDDQTGTFWQQISGRAVSGPLAGSQLELVYSDELTFKLWRTLAPGGMVLAPVPQYAKDYETKNWDARMAKTKTVLDFPNTALKSRDLVLGVQAFGASRAYSVDKVLKEYLIEDRIGGEPILVIVGPDNKSIRVFKARLRPGEAPPEYYRKVTGERSKGPNQPFIATESLFLDSETGSEWDFNGCAMTGKLTGACLSPLPATKDYWFDWRNYHPDTTVFKR
jgi:hypothetical protein